MAIIMDIREVYVGTVYLLAGLLALTAGTILAAVLVVIGAKKKEKEYHDV